MSREAFLKNIKYLLNKLDKQVGDLEEYCDLSKGYFSRLKNNSVVPNFETVEKVCEFLEFDNIMMLCNKEIVPDFASHLLNLGYSYYENTEKYHFNKIGEYGTCETIEFIKNNKTIKTYHLAKYGAITEPRSLTLEELSAIKTIVEELGWL